MKRKIIYLFVALSLLFSLIAVGGTGTVAAAGPWYVDPLGTDNGSHGTGPGAAAFLTIQYAINDGRVGGGDTINVAAGTYSLTASIIVNKSISIIGDINNPANVVIDAGTIPRDSGPKPPGRDRDGFQVAANDVVIKGFKIINALNLMTGAGDGWQNAGITVGGDITLIDWLDPYNKPILIDGGTFSNNIIEGCSVGIYLAMSKNVTVSHNIIRYSTIGSGDSYFANAGEGILNWNTKAWGTGNWQDPINNIIESNVIEYSARQGICLGAWEEIFSVSGTVVRDNIIRYSGNEPGIDLMYVTGALNITGNDIYSNPTGIGVGPGVSDVIAHYNNISGNTAYGIKNTSSVIVNATLNWWGTTDPVAIAAKITGPVTYNPWLGIPTTVYVDTTYTGTSAGGHLFGYDAFTTVQEGVTAVAADGTVNVAAGTYDIASTIVVNKALTISGPAVGGGGAKVQGTGGLLSVFEIAASNVVIQNLEITVTSAGTFNSPPDNELATSLIRIPSGVAMTGIAITGNTIYVPAQSGAMSTWNARAITAGSGTVSGISITGNTIYNTRNGVVIHYNNTATISNNTIYNTKGGIMNYTSTQADANNRTMSNNSWTTAHNEWDIVWNSGGGPYEPDYNQSVLLLSKANNDGYVVSLMTATADSTTLVSNRSHVFVNAATGTTTKKWSNGNMNLPYATIALGIEAVVPGGTVYVAAGTYNENINISKSLTLKGAQFGNAGYVGTNPRSGAESIIAGQNGAISAVLIGSNNVTIDGFKITLAPLGSGGISEAIALTAPVTGLIFQNNVIDGTGASGSQVNGVNLSVEADITATITRNYVANVLTSGITTGGVGTASKSTNVQITQNVVKNAGYAISGYLGGSSRIESNVVLGGASAIAGIAGQFDGLNIKNNTISGFTSAGQVALAVMGHAYYPSRTYGNVYVQGNTFSNNSSQMLFAPDLTVRLTELGTAQLINPAVLASILGLNTLDRATYITTSGGGLRSEDVGIGLPAVPVRASIQAAITAASSGDTIHVAAGTYDESMDITKPLTILGQGQTTTFIDRSANASAGTVVSIHNLSGNVKVDGFTIKTGPASSVASNGISISALTGPGTITISNNTIWGVQSATATAKDNFCVIAGYFTATTPKLVFDHNTVHGGSGGNPILIEKWMGPTEITNNILDNGIKDYGNSDVIFMMNYSGSHNTQKQLISHNTIDMGWGTIYDSSHRGTGISVVGSFTPPGGLGGFTDVQITNNQISNVKAARRGIGLTNLGATASNGDIVNAIISGNTITGAAGDVTASMGINTYGLVTNATITGNTITGVDFSFKERLNGAIIATGTQLNCNNFISGGSASGVVTERTSGTLNARSNWWGDASGPGPVGSGSGTKVSANVDYTSWLGHQSGSVQNLTTLQVYCTIQDAIDAATPGDTISVAAGTYDEQVVITKSLTLQGAGDTTIIRPSGAGILTSVYTYPVGIPIYAGVKIAGIVTVENVATPGVTIKDLKVDGVNITSLPADAARLAGILYGESAGTIQNVTVNTIKTTGYVDRTYGIDVSAAGTAVSVEVANNRISDFARNGIMANGGSLTANIHDNTITGPGTIGPNNVPNGIVFLAAVNGTIRGNIISACHYNVPLSWRSTGIMMYDTCPVGVVIENNEVYDVDDAINTHNDCIIRNNNIHGNGFGVVLEAGAYNNVITSNNLQNNTNGIQINGALNPNPEGVDPPGAGNVAHGNNLAGNTFGVISYDNTKTFDATNNWWGNASGPYDPSGTTEVPPCTNPTSAKNTDGTGDKVSDNVLYCPWTGMNVADCLIPLKAGWNMVSVPLTLGNNSVSAVFPGVAVVYTWDPVNKTYTTPTTVEPDTGYWVAVLGNETITVTGVSVTTWTSDIKPGWNMIGSVISNASIANPNDNPDQSVQPFTYWWNPVARTYVLTTNIEPGKGYWAASVRDCTLTLQGG